MKTNYYEPHIVSPFQVIGRKTLNERSKDHPITETIANSVGSHDLKIEFEEDRQTLEMFKNIPNLIAFVCKIKKDGNLIAFGHGASVINRVNRFIDKTVRSALNASLVDAIVRSKMLDALHFGPKQDAGTALSEAYKVMESSEEESITTRQRSYLMELIQSNIDDPGRRNELESQIDGMSKVDASDLIASFVESK